MCHHFAEFFLPEDEMILTSRKLGANKILSSEVFNKNKKISKNDTNVVEVADRKPLARNTYNWSGESESPALVFRVLQFIGFKPVPERLLDCAT